MDSEPCDTERAFRRRVLRRKARNFVVGWFVPVGAIAGFLFLWGSAFGRSLSEMLPFLEILVVVAVAGTLLTVGIVALTS